jgi:hypothetical protein
MRAKTTAEAEKFRREGPAEENYGVFIVKHGVFKLRCIVSCGMGWDHVSVSLANRCPTWEEMDFIKRLFWEDEEVVMQLHVHSKEKVNLHPNCLHLWRPQTMDEHVRLINALRNSGENPRPEWLNAKTPAPIPMPPVKMV